MPRKPKTKTIGSEEKKKKVWGSRQGSRISDRDAAIVGPILNKLPQGKRTARDIVDFARDESSKLHGYFEWDDSIASNKYREEQARYLMRSVILVGIEGSQGKIEPRAFHAVTFYDESDEEQAHVPVMKSYESLDIVQTTPEYMGQIRQEAMKDIRKFKHKYATLLDVGHAIDEIIGILKNAPKRGKTG